MLEVERWRENKRSASLHRIGVVQEAIWLGGCLHLTLVCMCAFACTSLCCSDLWLRQQRLLYGDSLHSLAAAALPGAASIKII